MSPRKRLFGLLLIMACIAALAFSYSRESRYLKETY
ncbi:MAG: hypothetical protein H6Q86_1395 [candidate division NC10 bacterium]|jgi:hypothetical protein|nr:hypothetical protein [candidate division NC10 bacterium]